MPEPTIREQVETKKVMVVGDGIGPRMAAVLNAYERGKAEGRAEFESELRRRVEGLSGERVGYLIREARYKGRDAFDTAILTALLAPPATPETERE